MIKWHGELWWCAKTMKRGGWGGARDSVLVCLSGFECIWLKSLWHTTFLHIPVPMLLPLVNCALLLSISQALPLYICNILRVLSLSLSLISSLLSCLLPTGPFPFALPNTVAAHSHDNQRPLVFPGHLFLYHATVLCFLSAIYVFN